MTHCYFPINGSADSQAKSNKAVKIVLQQFNLFPWLTVRENISFSLDLRKVECAKKNTLVNHYLTITKLTDFANYYPKDLSGGMQQRVAIARTLASRPKVLLMDEPFGALDALTRTEMQEFLTSLSAAAQHSIIFVTHDVGEAIFLANKVCVLSARPMGIKNTFIIPFDRPRLHALKQSRDFFELKNKITAELEN